jgi:Gas vesicle synthesis protein GvpL/GvpF
VSSRGPARDARRVYVFALCSADPIAAGRIGRHRLEAIELDGIVAIVERRSAPPILSEHALREQHRVVVELHRRSDALIPVRFGALLERAELEALVRRRRAVLARALTRVRGRAQMTMRSFGAPLLVRRESRATTGTAYLSQRARAARPDVPPALAAIRHAVRPLVVGEVIDPGRGTVRIVINHLIRVRDIERYRARVERVLADVRNGQSVVLSGPWPPFAFAPEIMDPTS